MSFTKPKWKIRRHSVEGMEAMHVKMFDPPKDSPETPDLVLATNPVPEVLAAHGFQNTPSIPHTINPDLMHGDNLPTWDNRDRGLNFMLIRDGDNPAAVGTFPGPTYRIPRGVVFHAKTQGHGPPPHTIHWHGIEPTPMNDGVGHTSMEIGDYTYQWQPNFIGFYFYHCHRNTVQHFEFGLYGALIVEPPDAYFATLYNPGIPIGHCRDGRRRIAANLLAARDENGAPLNLSTVFPGFNDRPITAPDNNWTGDPRLRFITDPHAMTVPYDVEALWVVDDRDSKWSDLAKDPHATFPAHGSVPGVNDNFQRNPAQDGFFAFNDYNADYWYVTGVPVPAPRGGVGNIPAGITIPPQLNSGVTGTQVSVNARTGQTILLRCLNAAYNCVEYTFPVDILIIAWDGRALGVPPHGECNHPYLVKAGTPIHVSTARRFDALCKSDVAMDTFATVKFFDSRGQVKEDGNKPGVLMTAQIPFIVGTQAPVQTFSISGSIIDASTSAPLGGVEVRVSPASLGGTAPKQGLAASDGTYRVTGLTEGMYTVTPSLLGYEFDLPGTLPGEHISEAQVTLNKETVDNSSMKVGVDFLGKKAAATYSISGRVKDKNNQPIAGVTITMSVGGNDTAVTDSLGTYKLTGLANGNYSVTPSLDGYTFAPGNSSVTIDDTKPPMEGMTGYDVFDLDFVGTFASVLTVKVVKASVSARDHTGKGPLWDISGTGTSGSIVNIFLGHDFSGEKLGDCTVDRRGKWRLRQFKPILSPLDSVDSISVLSTAGGQEFGHSLTTVMRAMVQARGKLAETLGQKWVMVGRGSPGTDISIFLGPNLNDALIGTVKVDRNGLWRFRERVRVEPPINETSISVKSSAGGVVLNQKLMVR